MKLNSAALPFPAPGCRGAVRATLSDGAEIRLQALSPADKPCFRAGLQRLSPQSRYLRFGRPVAHFSSEELRYLTEVDQVTHVAWGARDLSLPDGPGIGVARFVRAPEDPSRAEIALTVVDSHQRRGLGTLFLVLLWRLALAQGVKTFTGEVLAANAPMLGILEQLGAQAAGRAADWISVSARLPAGLEDFPDSPVGRRARAAAARLQL